MRCCEDIDITYKPEDERGLVNERENGLSCCGYIVYDSHTADHICENCAKVVAYNGYIYPISITPPHSYEGKHSDLSDICYNWNLSKDVVSHAAYLYEKLNFSVKDQGFKAYCVYRACVEKSCPRSMQEVARMFFVSTDDIYEKSKKSGSGLIDQVSPLDLVDRICHDLKITNYQSICSVKNEVEILMNGIMDSCQPHSVLAIAITNLNGRRNMGLSKKDIASACGVSGGCVKRLLRLQNQKMYK